MIFSTTFIMKAVGKGRARLDSRSGRHYTPAATREAEEYIKAVLMIERAPFFSGPVQMTVIIRLKRPKKLPKGRSEPVVKPDLSNILKLIEDAGNGILYKDDAQICSIGIKKIYAEFDSITLMVESMEP